MRALVGYESMYGNTRKVAEAIATGLAETAEVDVVPVRDMTMEQLDGSDLFVIGAPTHAHSLPRASSRKEAVAKAGGANGLVAEPTAEESGVREWLDVVSLGGARVAAFDTRVDMHPWVTGRASRTILRQMRRNGGLPVAPAESFLVDKDSTLRPGELDRARAWGESLAALMVPIPSEH